MKRTMAVMALALCAGTARADLSATVAPGYVFGSSERPTTSTLNRLGRPTITITGTVGGTNAALAIGSVLGSHFSGSVVDNVTTALNSSNAIEVATTCAGTALTGGGGVALSVLVDSNSIVIGPGNVLKVQTTNQMWLTFTNMAATNCLIGSSIVSGTTNTVAGYISVGAGLVLTNNTLTVAGSSSGLYVTTNQAVPTTDTILTWYHGLGAKPSQVRPVLVCTTTDLGYTVGDEVDLVGTQDTDDEPVATLVCSTNTIRLVCDGAGGGANWQVYSVSTPGVDMESITKGSWALKVYFWP